MNFTTSQELFYKKEEKEEKLRAYLDPWEKLPRNAQEHSK